MLKEEGRLPPEENQKVTSFFPDIGVQIIKRHEHGMNLMLLRVDSETIATDVSGWLSCGEASAKKRVPPINKHPKRTMPPPNNTGKKGLIDFINCCIFLS